jgi:AcrR family transcriptional regulator
MGRTGGEKTRKKILATAEKLFAEKGFDGTGIQDIAKSAGVNKALIYYHFKNKQDIVDSLFQETLDEMFEMQGDANTKIRDAEGGDTVEAKVAEIISFLEKKRKILSVMVMESLKIDPKGHLSLFQCANMIIEKNVSEIMHKVKKSGAASLDRNELLMHEFFTGFIPVVFFAIFKDRWADFFKCDKKETLRLFTKVFRESHIRHE